MRELNELIEFLDDEIRIETDNAISYGGNKGDAFDERIAMLTEIKGIVEKVDEGMRCPQDDHSCGILNELLDSIEKNKPPPNDDLIEETTTEIINGFVNAGIAITGGEGGVIKRSLRKLLQGRK